MDIQSSQSNSNPRSTRVFLSKYLGILIVLWLVMVFILCIVPLRGVSMPWSFTDKIVHALMYAVPAFLLTCSEDKVRYWPLYLLIFGIGVELVQSFLPYRSGDLFDVLANAGGILLGWCCAWLLLWLWSKRK